MLGLALHHGAEEHHRVADPDDRQEDVDRPLQFGVLLGGGETLRECEDRQHDHGLPAPEGEGRERTAEQAGLVGALNYIIRSGEQGAAAEGEDHCVGVQWAQAAKACPGQVEVEARPYQLGGDKHT
ncbi:hypothetical protein D3C78_1533370 [compost metagenome]